MLNKEVISEKLQRNLRKIEISKKSVEFVLAKMLIGQTTYSRWNTFTLYYFFFKNNCDMSDL